jgi:hypothetical protein
MRPGLLLGLLGVVVLAALALIVIPRKGAVPPPVEPGAIVSAGTTSAPGEAGAVATTEPRPIEAPAATNVSRTPKMSAEAREEQREAQVAARIAELRELSTKTDRGSLDTLLSELRNPQPEIREAALDIISESGNRGAIPGLIDAAAQTEDEGEKQAITKAIEFLQLPTLTETLNLQRSTGGATNRGP